MRAGAGIRFGVLLVLVAVVSVTIVSPTSAAEARTHHCHITLPKGFPGVSALRATRVGCREARGVARWIWRRIHRKASRGEHFELPRVVGPVRGRTFSCGYHGVEDAYDFLYYAARCSSGRALVRLHLSS